MSKGFFSMKFVGPAIFLSALLLIAVALAVSSRVVEGMEQKKEMKEVNVEAKAATMKAASTPDAGPKPAEAADMTPSSSCTADSCVYIPSAAGETVPNPGKEYTVSNCGPLTVAHKEGTEKSCSLAMMSHAIAAVCSKVTGGKEWCNLTDAQKNKWIPIPANLPNEKELGAMAAKASA